MKNNCYINVKVIFLKMSMSVSDCICDFSLLPNLNNHKNAYINFNLKIIKIIKT